MREKTPDLPRLFLHEPTRSADTHLLIRKGVASGPK